MSDVCIVGVDMIKFGRFPEKPIGELAADAALLALDDCGLTIDQIQSLWVGNVLRASSMVGQMTLSLLGQTGIPVFNVSNACASGATAFKGACQAVRTGEVDIAMAIGVEQMGKGLLGGSAASVSTEGVLGSGSMPTMFSQAGVEHSRLYGTTFEQFAKVSVKNHHHSLLNPKSMYRKETPLDEVMSAEMISYPNTKLMCSVNVDGAAAAIVMTEKKARELGLASRAIRVRSSVVASNPFSERHLAMPDFSSVTRHAAKQAYEEAGIGPEDIDMVELHDCFATAELLHYENLGLCKDGEAGNLIDEGETELGGRIPVNVSGGLLSKGHPLGATGIANIYEVSTHLRGEAGARQVEGARLGLTHVCGGMPGNGTACSVHILEHV
jgi:acetyl-CoA acyltransferase